MPTPSIQFHSLQKFGFLTDRTRLKQFLFGSIKKEGQKLAELNIIFCSDEYLLKINQDYLKHHDFTDIITFNLAEPKMPLIGEIYISIDRIRENAGLFKRTLREEMHRVIFHGCLHLCGYKDKTPFQKKEMRSREDLWLKRYWPSGLGPRKTVPRGKKA